MKEYSIGDEKTMYPGGGSGGYSLSEGIVFGQYKIIRALGRGGMGEVYEAEHTTLGKRYALKLLPADFAMRHGAVERFRREAKVMANLEHENILRVDDFGNTDGRYWLRMELAEGWEGNITLEDYAKSCGGKIPQKEMAEILKHILLGLDYAHSKGVVHRDLKPSNIVFVRDRGGVDPF